MTNATPPQAPPWSRDPKVIEARKNVEDLLAPGMPTLGDVALDALCAAVASSVPPAPSEGTRLHIGTATVVKQALTGYSGLTDDEYRAVIDILVAAASPSPPAPSPDIQDDPGDLYHRPRTKIEPDGRVAMCAGNHDWREPCQWSYRKMTIDELEAHLKAEAASPSPPAPSREVDWQAELKAVASLPCRAPEKGYAAAQNDQTMCYVECGPCQARAELDRLSAVPDALNSAFPTLRDLRAEVERLSVKPSSPPASGEPTRERLANLISASLIENDRRRGSTIPIKPLPGFIDELADNVTALYRASRSAPPMAEGEEAERQVLRKAMERISKALGYDDAMILMVCASKSESPADFIATKVEELSRSAPAAPPVNLQTGNRCVHGLSIIAYCGQCVTARTILVPAAAPVAGTPGPTSASEEIAWQIGEWTEAGAVHWHRESIHPTRRSAEVALKELEQHNTGAIRPLYAHPAAPPGPRENSEGGKITEAMLEAAHLAYDATFDGGINADESQRSHALAIRAAITAALAGTTEWGT